MYTVRRRLAAVFEQQQRNPKNSQPYNPNIEALTVVRISGFPFLRGGLEAAPDMLNDGRGGGGGIEKTLPGMVDVALQHDAAGDEEAAGRVGLGVVVAIVGMLRVVVAIVGMLPQHPAGLVDALDGIIAAAGVALELAVLKGDELVEPRDLTCM